MTTQDLSNNRGRIIKLINKQIPLATQDNIKGVMNKMLAMLPQFEQDKPTMSNIDKLAMKATLLYIKHDIVFTNSQDSFIDNRIAENKRKSLPSNLQY